MQFIWRRTQDGIFGTEVSGLPVVFVNPSSLGKSGLSEIRIQSMDLIWSYAHKGPYSIHVGRLGMEAICNPL